MVEGDSKLAIRIMSHACHAGAEHELLRAVAHPEPMSHDDDSRMPNPRCENGYF